MAAADTRVETQVATATRGRYMVSFRQMIFRDVPFIIGIEATSFARPWSVARFNRILAEDERAACMVIERGERIVGYLIYRFGQRFGQRYIEVKRLAVHPEYRGRGIGRQAIERLRQNLAGSASLRRFDIAVRERDLAAQRFLRACGVRANMVIPAWFVDTNEDAFLFTEAKPRGQRRSA